MKTKTVLWLVTGAGLLLCAGFGQLLRSSFAADSGLKIGGIPVQVKQAQHCRAFAPGDWSFWTNPAASTAEALSADRTMYAGWGVTAVNQAMRPYYGDLYGDPEASIRFLTNQILAAGLGDPSGMRYTSPPQPFLDYFLLRRFESAKHAGEVFYKIYPGGAPQMYVESVYWAIAAKSRGTAGLQTAAGVTVSIRCVTQFQYPPPASTASKGKRAAHAGCGTGGSLRGYQKELGTQYAHSPSTGQNFLPDPSTQWNAAGPQGAGYYRQVGNDYEKLEPGRDDDC